MSHLAKYIGRRRRQRPRQPFDRFTKAELYARLQAAERRCERAAGLANDLGRDLWRFRYEADRDDLAGFSERAYRLRDVARGDRATQGEHEDPTP